MRRFFDQAFAAAVLGVLAYFGTIWSATVVGDEPAAEALLALHLESAKAIEIALDGEGKRPLELDPAPVMAWTNPVGLGVQTGHLFVWTRGGRPGAIGTIFSVADSETKKRQVVFEFHALAPGKLFPKMPKTSRRQWTPEQGTPTKVLASPEKVEATPAGRLRQMREIARAFAVTTTDYRDEKSELRLLPKPLVRYDLADESAPPDDVVDGALFAMVSSAGTDPEALLLIEARAMPTGAQRWNAAALRFSDKDLAVQRDGRPEWDSKTDDLRRCRIEDDFKLLYVPDRTYMCFQSHVIDELATGNDAPAERPASGR